MNDSNIPTQLGDDTTSIAVPDNIVYLDGNNNISGIGEGDTSLISNFLSKEEADQVFIDLNPDKLNGEISYQQWYHMLPRKSTTAALKPLRRIKCALALPTEDGWLPHYRFPVNDQHRYPVKPIDTNTPVLLNIINKVRNLTNIPVNHIVVLYYKDGDDSIGFHKDKTVDLTDNTSIVSLSLGEERPYVLRKGDIFNPTETVEFKLPHGGLLTLGSKTNDAWFHSVKSLPNSTIKPRISITFRVVDTYRNPETGELRGKGANFEDLNWPSELGGGHRDDNYLDVPVECAELLTFWFGPGVKIEYNGGLWWYGIMHGVGGKNEQECKDLTDKYIRDKFGSLLDDDNTVKSWLTTPLGTVAAIILYDQMSRHAHRGTADAFKYDSRAYDLASSLLKEQSAMFSSSSPGLVDLNRTRTEVLPWVYQLFVYFTLIHSENINICAEGSGGLVNLQEHLKDLVATSNDASIINLASQGVHKLVSLLRGAKQHLQMLSKFGRYPHRNEALRRESTAAELEFLAQKDRPKWSNSQNVVATPTNNLENVTNKAFKVLVLHSNRQSPIIFQKRTKNILSKMVGAGSTLVYASAPHKYVAQGEAKLNSKHVLASNAESTKCWWNASDDPATMIYSGIEETINYVDQLALSHGPFDGIIGFSQGATLTGAIAALVSDGSPSVKNIAKSLQFTVIISGFYVRDVRPQFVNLNGPGRDKSNPIKIPSFHVWGLSDTLVLPERSIALKDSFAPEVSGIPRMEVPHQLDHFAKAIAVWPHVAIHKWINTYFTQRNYSTGEDLYSKLIMTKDPVYKSNPNMTYYINQVQDATYAVPINVTIDDMLAHVMGRLHHKDPRILIQNGVMIEMTESTIFAPKKANMLETSNMLVKIAERVGCDSDGATVDWLEKMRVMLSVYPGAISCFYQANKSTDVFRTGITTIVSESIMTSLANKKCDFIAETLPHKNNKLFLKHSLMNDIINRIEGSIPKELVTMKSVTVTTTTSNFTHTRDQIVLDVMETYEKVVNLLHSYVIQVDRGGMKKRELKTRIGERNPEKLTELLATPLHDAIVNPIPEPVEVATYQEMLHLHEYLRGSKSTNGTVSDEGQLVFPKGALCTDGRLDLCKQVIGPEGVFDLEKSLVIDGMSTDPKVKSLLLGNNIAGPKLAEAVSRMIKNKSTNIKIWYIAGNHLDAKGIAPVMEALEQDQYVDQLWLKRNPLKPEGGYMMQKMLSMNNHLKILDLTNVGLLDEGCSAVCKAISSNPNSAISVLYLSSNGIRLRGLQHVVDMLKVRKMYQVGLACNRLGDEGAAMIATVLDRIEDLEMSSCGLGYKGIEAISAALVTNTTLKVLDVGFLKSTNALGEVPNAMGNKGAVALAEALKTNRTLVSLDVLHNGIYQVGVSALAEMLSGEGANDTLLHLNIEQLGIPHNELTREAIRFRLKINMGKLDENQKKTALSYLSPPHLEIIRSVYRVEGI